jgi:hypothetical protein
MTDPAKLGDTVRTLAIRAHRLRKRTTSLGPGQGENDELLEDIELLNQMISDSHLHQTQLAAWSRNLRREVADRARAGIAADAA